MFMPKLRDDLRTKYFSQDGKKYIILYDDLMIAKEPVAIPEEIFEKIKSNADPKYFVTNNSEDLQICENLSLLGFMDTAQVRLVRDDIRMYLKSTNRPPVCAGISYPENNKELNDFMHDLFMLTHKNEDKSNLIFAPHIDFRVGENAQKIYADTFNNLDRETDLFIIFGTAHYKSSDLFMFSRKNFETPLGTVKTDLDFLRLLQEKMDYPITYDELAHKPEHSIELHLILIQYLMGKKDFTIVPILTGSFFQFIQSGISPNKSDLFNLFIKNISELINKYHKKITIIASGDMSHIGRKFGDSFDADQEIENVQKDDKKLINSLININKEEFFNFVSSMNDKNKICGLSPFYSALSLANPKSGNLRGYSFWNEKETESAVSFCGITFEI